MLQIRKKSAAELQPEIFCPKEAEPLKTKIGVLLHADEQDTA